MFADTQGLKNWQVPVFWKLPWNVLHPTVGRNEERVTGSLRKAKGTARLMGKEDSAWGREC